MLLELEKKKKMKIKYISDVHLEFSRFPVSETIKELAPSKDEILLVAGDTVVANYLKEKRTDGAAAQVQVRFKEFLEAVKEFKSVYMVMGNHEHYHGNVLTSYDLIKNFIEKQQIDNVHLLENERVDLTDHVSLLACSLWTDMNKENPMSLESVSRMMNDFRICDYGNEPFHTTHAAAIHKESKTWLKSQLDGKRSYVVMTHHCPSFTSIDPFFKGDVMNFGYASELDDFIMMHPEITHWVHGHTHYNVDYKIGSCHVLGNMRGYPPDGWSTPRGNWKGFKADKWFDV